jgi:hypothetical protein
MRRLGILALVLAVATAFVGAADERTLGQRTKTVEPQVVLTIEHVPGTGDLVEMLYSSGTYDEASLNASLSALESSLGSPLASVETIPPATEKEPVKVFFVAQGLIDPSLGDFRLQPLVRALMKDQDGKRVESFSIRIVGQEPSAYTTLASYSSNAVVLRAFYHAPSKTIEYRILVLASDPDEVSIPPRHVPDTTVRGQEEEGGSRASLILGLILTAGASAGALVYFALLGKRA